MAQLDTFPVSFKVAGRRIVIVGGGVEALNKTRLALKTSADVNVWARVFDPGFDNIVGGRLTLNRRENGLEDHLLRSSWLDGVALMFIADNGEDGAFAEGAARAEGIPVNVVDSPGRCDFYTPAIVDRAPISVAIASEGAAPVIARRLRAKIEAMLPPEIGQLADLAGRMRSEVETRLGDGGSRRRYYERLADSEEISAKLSRDPTEAEHAAHNLLDEIASGVETGAIAFVGAGPGAEDLLTLRAQRLLQAADVIVHDQSVPSAVIEMGRRDAERHPVADGLSLIEAAEIGAHLVSLAAAGKKVVRLVAGDASDMSETGVEIAAAKRAGIFVTMVPGVAASHAAQCLDFEPKSRGGSRRDAQRVA